MGEHQSGSQSRYSIDTLFPGLTRSEEVKMEWEDEEEVAEGEEMIPQGDDGDEDDGEGRMNSGPGLKAPSGRRRNGMFQVFQPWVLRTYGDSAKTKTITKKKAARIVKTLRGEELNNAENSKFRFWVKAKGFQLGPPGGQEHPASSNEPQLYVPTTVKNGTGGVEKAVYKRVAVVEYFFDIIYRVHVETEAKNGKHAGQKRTYRAITEKYAFLPREAVTKFLLQCTDCQKRGSPGVSEGLSPPKSSSRVSSRSTGGDQLAKGSAKGPLGANSRLPFQLRERRKQMSEGFAQDVDDDDEEGQFSDPNSGEDEIEVRPRGKGKSGDGGKGEDRKDVGWLGAYSPLVLKKEGTNNNVYSNGKGSEFRDTQSSPTSLSLSERLGGGNNTSSHGVEHGGGGGGHHDETGSNGAKDDEDDEDDESEDKMDTHSYDPERLKAFNMFVRLFVDENLDRMVPISKQPKEKIQAIIDSCTRQFPEFAERARKRIRTYLKSCRRNKRSRDGGWESSRPTPAHLTSVQAEQILAQACENESQNAKRMRMGLEPVSQPLPNSSESRKEVNGVHGQTNGSSLHDEKSLNGKGSSSSSASNIAATIAAVASNTTNSRDGGGCVSPAGSSNGSASSSEHNGSNSNAMHLVGMNGESGGLVPASKSLVDRTNPLVDFRGLNGSPGGLGMFRGAVGGFAGGAFPRPPLPSPFPALFPSAPGGLPPPPLSLTAAAPTSFSPPNVSPLPPTSAVSSLLSNGDAGPTDLSMKSAKAMPLGGLTSMSQKLNASELATVRQLITGYRESAAFLLRSADELEQLLLQQQ